MPDGSLIVLKKLAEDYDPRSREGALAALAEGRRERKLVTGLLLVQPDTRPYEDELELVETPLARLSLEQVRPPERALEEIMQSYRVGTVAAGGGGGGGGG